MKLRDFNRKPTSRKSQTKIILQNDSLEKKYKSQIDDLNTQLGFYRRIEAERDEAKARHTAIEQTLKEERIEFDKCKEEIEALKETIDSQSLEIQKIPVLQDDYKSARGEASVLKSQVDNMSRELTNKSQDITRLNNQVENLKQDSETLEKQTKEAVSLKHSADVDFEMVSNKNKELKSFADETSKINKELFEKNKSLIDLVNYHEVENKELSIQLEELRQLETKLRGWVGSMETESTNIKKSKNSLENKVSNQTKIITEMSSTLDDIMKELLYVRKLNKVYREQLAKPTYTSTAAIASQEGFVMPNGKENIRTHNLGNYKPTMLKFKKKEEVNNGR